MELLKNEEIASVTLFDLRISESELQVFADALSFVLKLDDQSLDKVFAFEEEEENLMPTPSETRAFIEDSYNEVMFLVKNYCQQEFLPKRFKDLKP